MCCRTAGQSGSYRYERSVRLEQLRRSFIIGPHGLAEGLLPQQRSSSNGIIDGKGKQIVDGKSRQFFGSLPKSSLADGLTVVYNINILLYPSNVNGLNRF